MERPPGVGLAGAVAGLIRLLPVLVVAVNLTAAIGWMQAIITGLFPWSHHWIFPGIAVQLLVQAFLFRRRGPVLPFAGLTALLLAIAIARLPTIAASHHLIHFAMAFALSSILHWRMAFWESSPAWGKANRWWAAGYAVVAAAAAVLAWRSGIWWGISDGT